MINFNVNNLLRFATLVLYYYLSSMVSLSAFASMYLFMKLIFYIFFLVKTRQTVILLFHFSIPPKRFFIYTNKYTQILRSLPLALFPFTSLLPSLIFVPPLLHYVVPKLSSHQSTIYSLNALLPLPASVKNIINLNN